MLSEFERDRIVRIDGLEIAIVQYLCAISKPERKFLYDDEHND